MTIDAAETAAPGLIQRARSILTQPSAEWARIAAEETPVPVVVTRYLAPLVSGVALAGVLGGLLMSGFYFGAGMVIPLLAGAAVQIVFGVVGVLFLGFVINALAPSFGSEKNQDNAFRLAIYSATALLVAGLTLIVPVLAFLLLVAGVIYSAMLLHAGLASMMKTPEDKRVAYTLTSVGIAVVAAIIMSMLYGSVMQIVRSAPLNAFGREAQLTAEVEAASGLSDFRRQALQNESGLTIDHERVHEQLPQTLPGGFRLESSQSSAVDGMAQAVGIYRSGESELRLTVVQTGAMAALATFAEGMNVQESEQGRDGYSRSQTIDGRLYSERVDIAGSSANYGIVGRGVAVRAEGSNITLDQARAAVETVGVQRLEREFGV